jgi:DNA-3-methyladenine glycosylase I
MKKSCPWPAENPLMIHYHDTEWGIPVHDDTKLFEFMVLDAFQAGLSWLTILKKRENFRKAFDNFDVLKIASYGEKDFERLMKDAGIIRNRLKILASIDNAKAFIKIQKEFGSFDAYIWKFTGNKPVMNHWKETSQVPARSELSDKISKDLKKRGFRFTGTTIIYAFLQAAGLVNDHLDYCFCNENILKAIK